MNDGSPGKAFTRIRRTLCVAVGVSVLTIGGLTVGQIIRTTDLTASKEGIPGEERYERTVDIGPGVKMDMTVEATVRRNGTLRIGNLALRILDEYDDGMKYVDGMLHTEFKDITGDGFKDLIVTGTVAKTGEKETDPVTYATVTSIYAFRPEDKDFKLVFHVGPDLDVRRK